MLSEGSDVRAYEKSGVDEDQSVAFSLQDRENIGNVIQTADPASTEVGRRGPIDFRLLGWSGHDPQAVPQGFIDDRLEARASHALHANR